MAVSTEESVIDCLGNNSTVTPYAIPFPFLAAENIRLAISPDGVAAFVEQASNAFSVIRNPDGQGGTLKTVAAQGSPKVVKIWRTLAYTQPSVFQPQGPLPAKTVETALDRATMLIQQLAALIDGAIPGAGASVGNKTWLNAAARALVVPDDVGQLGSEQETDTVWIALSTAAGDWREYRPLYTNKLTIGFVADAGTPGTYQSAIATLFNDWDVDAALFGGDNNYSGAASYAADWAAFNSLISAGIAYPALGNHDIDEAGWQARLDAKFPYLPGNRRYYKITLGDGLVDLFVLNSGRNSIWDLIEVDGNSSSSVQHAWFVSALAASRSRWKIAMFHHPPITTAMGSNRHEPAMAWPELSRMDLVLCGHSHLLEVLKWSNVQLVTVGATVRNDGDLQALPQSGAPGDAALWADDDARAACRIVATQMRLTVELWEIGQPYQSNRLMHVREARDFTKPMLQTETFQTHGAATVIPDSGTIYVCTLPAATILREVEISSAVTGAEELEWTVKGGIVTLASGIVGDGEIRGAGYCIVPDDMIPRGTVISLEWLKGATDLRAGMSVSLIFERYK